MPRATKASKVKDDKQPLEQQLEEGVRVDTIKGLSMDKGGSLAAPSDKASLEEGATKLQTQVVDIDRAIGKASAMLRQMLGAAEQDMEAITSSVLALATGEMTTDQLVQKYGTLTNAEASERLSTLAQVSNAIGVKIKAVEVQTQGLELERTKLLRTKKTFQVMGTALEVMDAADQTAFQQHQNGINHAGRQDQLDYSEDKRLLTKDRNADNLTYRGESNRLEKENEQNILSHKQSVNQILEQARATTRSILQAKVTKRQYTAKALEKENNGASQGGEV